MARVEIRGGVVQIDDDDLHHMAGRSWHVNSKGYARATTGNRSIYLHRLVLGAGRGQMTDHENGDRLDCRRSNLRLATAIQNAANMRDKPGSSRFKGVYWHGGNQRWYAEIAGDHLGSFPNEVDAADAYDVAAIARWGSFARTNRTAPEG